MSSERVKFSRRAALAALPGVRLTRAVAAEQVRSSNASAKGKGTTPPVLGNLFETLATYAREAPPSYAYNPHRWPNLESWKRDARAKCLEHLAYHPPVVPLDSEVK